jgi:hypothetical protein
VLGSNIFCLTGNAIENRMIKTASMNLCGETTVCLSS